MRLLQIICLCGAVLWSGAVHSSEVRDVRVWEDPDATRVVLDLSAAAPYKNFLLDAPARLVVDLPGTQLARGVEEPAGAGLARRIRTGQPKPGVLRVVVELESGAEARAFLSPPNQTHGHRLVIELRGASASVPRPVVAAHAPKGARDIVVAIDAGHGGEDPGAIGKAGTREKDVTLKVARELARRINGEPGMKAVLTRTGDYFVPFRERLRRARVAQADLFVSVHADAFMNRSVRGSSVYVLSTGRASNEAARWLADRENAADLVGGVSLDDKSDVLASVLLDLSQNAVISASREAASRVLTELDRVGDLKKTEVQHASLIVLTSPDIPSMLIETAYISNPDEEKKLRDPGHQGRLAEAIHAGVRKFFYASPPPGTRIAQIVAERAGVTASLGAGD
ncbi:MAG: N-acetylmuramoyl-L-alanine amidase [Steroidobacteraceae bacterium]